VLQSYQLKNLKNLQTKIYKNNPYRTTPYSIAYVAAPPSPKKYFGTPFCVAALGWETLL